MRKQNTATGCLSQKRWVPAVGFHSEVQRFEAWQYDIAVVNWQAIEDGIQVFDTGSAKYVAALQQTLLSLRKIREMIEVSMDTVSVLPTPKSQAHLSTTPAPSEPIHLGFRAKIGSQAHPMRRQGSRGSSFPGFWISGYSPARTIRGDKLYFVRISATHLTGIY